MGVNQNLVIANNIHHHFSISFSLKNTPQIKLWVQLHIDERRMVVIKFRLIIFIFSAEGGSNLICPAVDISCGGRKF